MSQLIPIQVIEIKIRTEQEITHTDFLFTVEERDAGSYGHEVWGFLCDQYGYRYVYSLPIHSTKYLDGYLDKNRRGDWHACAGGMGYNILYIREAEMLRALKELGYE